MSRLAVAAAFAALLPLAACGSGSDGGSQAADPDRTIEVDMVDIAFKPDAVKVAKGETVRFVFANRGEVVHDAFIGDAKAQADHEAEMRQGGDGHGHGDESEDAITVAKGGRGELVYTFDEAGAVEIGCHQPGHYESGMKIKVEVF